MANHDPLAPGAIRVAHLLSGLAYGGKEQIALDIAREARAQGDPHLLILYDTPYRSAALDLQPHDVPWHHITRGKGLDIRFIRDLARTVRHQRVDIVHAHAASAIVYAALMKIFAWPFKVKAIGTLHVKASLGGWRGRIGLLAASFLVDRLFAVSDALARESRGELHYRGLKTIHNGIDLDLHSPQARTPQARSALRQRLGIPSSAFVVGSLGRLAPIKRHHDLILAATEIQHTSPDVHIVIGGDGELKHELEAAAAGLKNVSLIGPVADKAAFYGGLDAFALCSGHEAAPLVLLEAMAYGLPVVATDVGGVPEFVGAPDSLCRALVPVACVECLSAAIAALAAARPGLSQACAGNRERAERFGTHQMFKRYRAEYRALVGR